MAPGFDGFYCGRRTWVGYCVCRAMKIAAVHDIAEAITGDIDFLEIYDGKIEKIGKQKIEKEAVEKLKNFLSPEIGKEIFDLWYEYEKSETKEAKFIKALDKIETLTQLAEAGYKTYDRPEIIANYADDAVKNFPELLPVLKFVKRKLKEEFVKAGFEWKGEYNKT
jgi:putative hydrolase of HD superfamily